MDGQVLERASTILCAEVRRVRDKRRTRRTFGAALDDAVARARTSADLAVWSVLDERPREMAVEFRQEAPHAGLAREDALAFVAMFDLDGSDGNRVWRRALRDAYGLALDVD